MSNTPGMSHPPKDRVGERPRVPRPGIVEEIFQEIRGALPVGVEPIEAASAVLCTLLARLELKPARELLDALGPDAVEAIGRCPIHAGAPGESFDDGELLRRVSSHFELAPEAVRPMTASVLNAVRQRVPPDTAALVERQLPRSIVELWRGAGAP